MQLSGQIKLSGDVMAGLLGDIFSAGNVAKRKLTDLLGNPILSAQQMLGNLNDRARVLNEMTTAAAREGVSYGPSSQQLAGLLSEAYNPVGMTVIPFGKSRSVLVPAGQDFVAVNPAEVRAREAINDLVTHSRYFGVDSPADLSQMPIGNALAHLDEYLGQSTKVADLPENAKASLRNLWVKAENAAKAYKRIYGEERFMGKTPEPKYESSKKFTYNEKKIAKQLQKGEITQKEYDEMIAWNRQND